MEMFDKYTIFKYIEIKFYFKNLNISYIKYKKN